MSDQSPYEKLGVKEDASFDEIQDAKGRLMQQYRGDQKQIETVEAAYDAIIMDRLRMRQEGKIKVPERIRFPEKLSQSPPSFPQVPVSKSPAWLQQMFDTPAAGEMLWPAVSYLGLGAWTAFAGSEEILPLTLALGFGCSIYFLNRKEGRFGRAVLIALIGLLVGLGIGTLLTNYVVTTPIASIGSLRFATLVTFLILWLISCFLR